MRKFWPLTLTLFQALISLEVVYSQESEKLIEPTVSCLGLQDPKDESQMNEFKECIKKFNAERKLIKKNKVILQKVVDSVQLINQKINLETAKNNIDHRIPMSVRKLGMLIKRRKFEASIQLSKQINKTLKR